MAKRKRSGLRVAYVLMPPWEGHPGGRFKPRDFMGLILRDIYLTPAIGWIAAQGCERGYPGGLQVNILCGTLAPPIRRRIIEEFPSIDRSLLEECSRVVQVIWDKRQAVHEKSSTADFRYQIAFGDPADPMFVCQWDFKSHARLKECERSFDKLMGKSRDSRLLMLRHPGRQSLVVVRAGDATTREMQAVFHRFREESRQLWAARN